MDKLEATVSMWVRDRCRGGAIEKERVSRDIHFRTCVVLA